MKKLLFAVAALAGIAMGCKQLNYEKNKAGLLYKIFPGKERGDSLKPNDLVKYTFAFSTKNSKGKDTVFATSADKIPAYGKVDTSEAAQLSPVAPFIKARVGDSIELMVSIDSLAKQPGFQYNELFIKGHSIIARMRILKKFKDENELNEDRQKEIEIAMKRQEEKDKVEIEASVKEVEKYLADKGIKNAQKTKTGAYVVVETPGDQTTKADSGKIATMKYKGYLMTDEKKVFDNNMDSTAPNYHKDPFTFPVGGHQVIKAWDEAIPYFGKGGKGKIYVPYMLGYGVQGDGPGGRIPAKANLIFDVEVLDVKGVPAPAQPAVPVAVPQAKQVVPAAPNKK